MWRAAETGIHRSVLCKRAELTPEEVHSLLIRLGHVLRRFQRRRGGALSGPVASNRRLQSYFIDSDFAAVAASDTFGERMLSAEYGTG